MTSTFSIGIAPGYVESGGQFALARGMDVINAAYLTGQAHPGGVAQLARDMGGIKAGTLQHKLNINNETHQLTLPEVMRVQAVTGNFSILHAMAYQFGCEVRRAIPDQSGGDPVEALAAFHVAVAEVSRASADALRPSARVSPNAVRRLEQRVQELISSAGHLARAADAQLRNGQGGGNAY